MLYTCKHSLYLYKTFKKKFIIFIFFYFFFNNTFTPEIYTLSLHDALPIWLSLGLVGCVRQPAVSAEGLSLRRVVIYRNGVDRKSTRLNSSHRCISYAVFCLKKKKRILFLKEIIRRK